VEECLELVPGPPVEEDRFCPATTGAQDIPEGKPATGNQSLEFIQCDTTRQDIAHVHIHTFEAGPVKAAAISVWPLTPCSRSTATLGLAPVLI